MLALCHYRMYNDVKGIINNVNSVYQFDVKYIHEFLFLLAKIINQ